MQVLDLPSKVRSNLDNQVRVNFMKIDLICLILFWKLKKILINNPKLVSTIENGTRKYTFKPYLFIRNRKELIKLIKDHQDRGVGGVLLEDVQESMTTEEFDKVTKVFCLLLILLRTKSNYISNSEIWWRYYLPHGKRKKEDSLLQW